VRFVLFVPLVVKGLFVQVIERSELPSRSRLREVIDHYLIARGVGTGYSKRFRVCRIHLWLCFTEAGCGISLFVEKLTISPG
jgi:hypothetical protein